MHTRTKGIMSAKPTALKRRVSQAKLFVPFSVELEKMENIENGDREKI